LVLEILISVNQLTVAGPAEKDGWDPSCGVAAQGHGCEDDADGGKDLKPHDDDLRHEVKKVNQLIILLKLNCIYFKIWRNCSTLRGG